MNVDQKNELLARGEIEREDMWPHIVEFESKAATFPFEFGLDELPKEPGLIVVRGPRQYGKSTWLELELRDTVNEFGPGSAFYLNGDDLIDTEHLFENIVKLDSAFSKKSRVKRLFIDEVTAITNWELAIKRAVDRGHLRDVLTVTTGSKAFDLRRGSERLPGRKGKLTRTDYIFLPVSYRAFYENCHRNFGDKTWIAYLLAGGSPLGCNDIYQFERIPEYFIQLLRDWIYGEVVSSGRSRIALTNILLQLYRFGGTPVGFTKLARECGLANNTVASGYIEQLSDLLCVLPAWVFDAEKKIFQFKKACKFHFINLAAAITFHPKGLRYVHEYEALPAPEQGILLEWLVSQELWRRSVLYGNKDPEVVGFWQSKNHEIDFVSGPDSNQFIEVKLGKASPLDFAWFSSIFPKAELTVVCKTPFESRQVKGITIHEFLMDGAETP